MKEERLTFERLARKNFHVSFPVMDKATWKRFVAPDISVPRTFSRLREYGQLLYGKRRRKYIRMIKKFPKIGAMRSLYEECGESAWYRLFLGLANPRLTKMEREAIEGDMDADMPTLEHSEETDHFILRWTDSSADASDNITDAAIITETGNFLETAWDRYQASFGRTPYIPVGSSKMEIVFYDIPGAHGVASPPDGPLQLNSDSWMTIPGLRRSVSAHELFHKLQYSFGYRTSWAPVSPYKWFSEGTASWSEVFVWQRVSRASKITDLFTNPDLNLYNASYSAVPFWIFFEARQKSSATDNPILHFLTTAEPAGDLQDALQEVIDEEWAPNNVYGQLDNFYALFARERRIGAWKMGPTGNLYSNISDPDGAAITPNLTVTDVPMGLSDTYSVGQTVSQLGSDYYRFVFEPDADGRTFSFSVTGASGGDFSFYLLWDKNNAWKRAAFPPGSTSSYSHSEVINLAEADAMVLVISGRGTGGAYALNASIA